MELIRTRLSVFLIRQLARQASVPGISNILRSCGVLRADWVFPNFRNSKTPRRGRDTKWKN